MGQPEMARGRVMSFVVHNPLSSPYLKGGETTSSTSNPEIEMGCAYSAFVFFSPDPLDRFELPVVWPSFPGSIPS